MIGAGIGRRVGRVILGRIVERWEQRQVSPTRVGNRVVAPARVETATVREWEPPPWLNIVLRVLQWLLAKIIPPRAS